MAGGRVLLLVSGGIAAYKACYLTRLLRQAGLDVKVAMTDAAQRFVTPMTFQVLSENPVASDLWGEGQSRALDHIEYARWADVAVIAPATANVLAKLAHGIADDIVSTLLLAHPGPLIAAPAMNDNMGPTRRPRPTSPSCGRAACTSSSRARAGSPAASRARGGLPSRRRSSPRSGACSTSAVPTGRRAVSGRARRWP